MRRAGLGFLLSLFVGCAEEVLVVAPPDDGAETEVYLVRTVDGAVRVIVHGISDPSIELEDPEQITVFRYREPLEKITAWIDTPNEASCGLLAGEVYELRLTEPLSFIKIEPSDEQFGQLLPGWESLCVTCRPFAVRSLLYPVPPGDPDLVRSGGAHAELPSGAFLAAGAYGDGFFRVTEDVASPVAGGITTNVRRLVRIGPRRYVATDEAHLRVLEIDEAETTLSVASSLTLEGAAPFDIIIDLVVSSSTAGPEFWVVDSLARVLRTDLSSWTLVTTLPLPPEGWLDGQNLLLLGPDHFLLTGSHPTIYDWNSGRLREHVLERGKVAAFASVPGFGVLVGDSYGQIFALEEGTFRSLGLVDNEDDIDSILPYRGGFLAVSKGGFIDAYAPQLEDFCPVSSTIPGAQNASLASFTAIPGGFFCSDCLQSRSGGAYGAAWLSDR